METLSDEFLARAALTNDEDGTSHGGRTACPLDRIEEGAGLADELGFPLHDQ